MNIIKNVVIAIFIAVSLSFVAFQIGNINEVSISVAITNTINY